MITTVARIFLGLVFTVFGLNGFFNFIPPPEMPAEAGAFIGAMMATGYLFPLLKAVEVVCGVMLLANRYVPLALTLLVPVITNILFFHLFLAAAPAAIAVPILCVAAEIFLIMKYWKYFESVFTMNAVPSDAKQEAVAA